MARRKNTKRIDPRYFLNETAHRDLNEQQGQVLDMSNPREFRSAYVALRQKLGKDPVLKNPGEVEYYQLRVIRKTGRTSTGDYDNKFGYALDYSTVPNMTMPGYIDKIEPGDRAATDPAVWLAQTLLKSRGINKVEVIG